MKGIAHPAHIPTFSTVDHRTREEIRAESERNPYIPGARVIRRADAIQRFNPAAGCSFHPYPLSAVNDFGFFSFIDKKGSSDQTHPWAIQAHPDVNLYILILSGRGEVVLGEGSPLFKVERYEFWERDMVIVPRGIPYRMTGEWTGVAMHTRTSVFGRPAGIDHLPHPVVTFNKPARPTPEEASKLREPGDYTCSDPAMSMFATLSNPVIDTAVDPAVFDAVREAYGAVTHTDQQTLNADSLAQMGVNPHVLGARVLRKAEIPDLYNANAAGKVYLYPTTWTDDVAVFAGLIHDAKDDAIRPFDSHSHPDIEECSYIISGSGWIQLGVGDETFETETYEFHEGDLVIIPRSVPHYEGGTFESLHFHARQSVFGKVPGSAATPHIAYVYTMPPRPNKEEEAAVNAPGTFIYMDSRETYNIYAPDPFLRVQRNPIDMFHLRPDIFGEQHERAEPRQ